MTNLYDKNSGNVIMRGTAEYELAALEGKPGYNEALAAYRKKNTINTASLTNATNIDSLREELQGYSHEELVNYYHTAIDPESTEDLSGMDEEDLIELILEKVQEMSGGKRRRKQRKSYRKKRGIRKSKQRATRKSKQRKSRKNRRN